MKNHKLFKENYCLVKKWFILITSTFVMMVISIYQYSWTIFSTGIQDATGWSKPTIDMAYTIYSYVSTFIQPISGYLADTFNPNIVALTGVLLTSAGFLTSSAMSTPWELYLYYGMGSAGVGFLYGLTVALAIRMFPDRRGLATGIVTFGFGAGTAVFNVFLDILVREYGFKKAFLYTGLAMVFTLTPISLVYRCLSVKHNALTYSYAMETHLNKCDDGSSWKWYEMLLTRQWYVIYFSMIVISAVPLMLGAQLKSIAIERNIPISALYTVLSIYPLANGLSRILGGWFSDKIGRQLAMTIFYLITGFALLALPIASGNPALFVLVVFVIALFSGAVYSFTPSIIGDYYGMRYAAVNYGITYTGKAWGGLLSGYFMSLLYEVFGTHTYSILSMGFTALVVSILVNPRLLHKPLRQDPKIPISITH